jgi:Protein of unknown function (DUF732)
MTTIDDALSPYVRDAGAEPASAQLAWSLVEDDAAAERQPWRSVWRNAAGVLMISFAVASAVLLGRSFAAHDVREAATSVPAAVSAPPPAAAPEPTATVTEALPASPELAEHLQLPTTAESAPPAAADNDADAVYLTVLQRSGITITNRDNAIVAGHTVCTLLSQGHSVEDIAAMTMRSNPTFTLTAAEGAAVAAVVAYCPDRLR